MLRWLVAFLFLAASPALADSCKPDLAKARARLEAARVSLNASLPNPNDLDTGVSSRERTRIAVLQTRLHDYLGTSMRCAVGDGFEKTLGAGAPKLGFVVRRFRPDLVGVTATFDIQCGNDTVLAIFARKDGAWREMLSARSKPYTKVSGAWGSFDYGVSPPDASGHWFAVVTTIAPWCSSSWSTIRYEVLRPEAKAPLLHAEDTIWWGAEDYGTLSVGMRDFMLRFHAGSIDGEVHNRAYVRHFSVEGDRVARIAPFADSARDFLEEWINARWPQARAWTAPSLRARVREAHDKFLANPYGTYRSVRQCAPGLVEIEVMPQGTNGSLFFEVAGTRDYTITGAANRADPDCRGRVLYQPAD